MVDFVMVWYSRETFFSAILLHPISYHIALHHIIAPMKQILKMQRPLLSQRHESIYLHQFINIAQNHKDALKGFVSCTACGIIFLKTLFRLKKRNSRDKTKENPSARPTEMFQNRQMRDVCLVCREFC